MEQEPQRGAASLIRYRAAKKEDLYDVARVYQRAFPESANDFFSPHLSPLAIADIMRAPLEADPGSILLAQAPGGEVVGYIIAVIDTAPLLHTVVFHGLFLRWVWRWLRGMYRLSWRGARMLLQDKLRLREAWKKDVEFPARILSLAVDPDWQRRGLGRQLLSLAMQRLRAMGRTAVSLEVRPNNVAARTLYEQMGFRELTRFNDSRGYWIVLVGITE